MQRHHANSTALCRYVAAHTDTVLLSFSNGKDAIGAWLQLRRHFKRIVPFYMYLVPGLAFVERSLAYYEEFFQTSIIRLPNPHLYRLLVNLVYQPPERCHLIEEAGLDIPSRDQIAREAALLAGLSPRTFTATGVRALDNLTRRAACKKHGALNPGRRTFWPIFDWTVHDLDRDLTAARVHLPVDYLMFGRTFDGLFYQYLKPVKDRFPEDYAKILEWFPLAELEILRHEKVIPHA